MAFGEGSRLKFLDRLSLHWPLALVLAAAAVVRFWGLTSGVPYTVGVDEPVTISIAVRMMKTGDLHPHFFDYPTLYIYVQLAAASLRFLVGASQGLWQSLDQVGLEHFYVWGRAVTAILGVATVALVYACGWYWGRMQAILAASLMAVFPMHVRESHFVLTDVPAAFFVTLALYFSLRASERNGIGKITWAGAASGLAVATKYNAMVVLVLPLIAAVCASGGLRVKIRNAAVAMASAAVAFLVFAPYTILDLPAFLEGIAKLAGYYRPRLGQEPGWLIYGKHLRLTMGWPALGLALAGLAYALFSAVRDRGIRGIRGIKGINGIKAINGIKGINGINEVTGIDASPGPTAARWWLVSVYPLLYFAFVSRQGLIFGRYLMPLVPFLPLLVGISVAALLAWTRSEQWPRHARVAALVGVSVVILWHPVRTSIGFNRMITRPLTTGEAYAWILKNVPPGSKFVSERYEVRLPETQYYCDTELRLANRDYDSYVKAGVQYLIASSNVFGPVLNGADPEAKAAYERLFARSQEIFRVEPSERLSGPEVRVYALTPKSN